MNISNLQGTKINGRIIYKNMPSFIKTSNEVENKKNNNEVVNRENNQMHLKRIIQMKNNLMNQYNRRFYKRNIFRMNRINNPVRQPIRRILPIQSMKSIQSMKPIQSIQPTQPIQQLFRRFLPNQMVRGQQLQQRLPFHQQRLPFQQQISKTIPITNPRKTALIMNIRPKKYYSSVMLVIKNDEDLLIEWVNHYKKIGFDHIYLIDNGTTPPLNRLIMNDIQTGYITYIYDKTQPIEVYGNNLILNKYRNETTWLACFSSDEFLVLKQHNKVNDFLKEYEAYAGIGVIWFIYGSSGHQTHQENTLVSYTKRIPNELHYTDLYAGQFHYKPIVMTDRTIRIAIHEGIHINGTYAVDESKMRISGPKPRIIRNDIIQLNHYVIRSMEDFQNKLNRRGGDGSSKKMEYYINTDANCTMEDKCMIERHYREYL
jgi:hypothetical protein